MHVTGEASTKPRAFLTCAARAHARLAPLLEAVELALLDLGYGTRVPRRTGLRESLPPSDRRRIRLSGYHELSQSDVVIHVPAGALLAGVRMHHELAQAVKLQLPILLIVARAKRHEFGLDLPAPERLEDLARLTKGVIVEELSDLEQALKTARRKRSH